MSSKFKMPPHPIYWHNGSDLVSSAKEDERHLIDFFKNGLGEDTQIEDIFGQVLIMERVARSGHVLIKIDGKDWDETFSQKTLSSLSANDILLPYNAFTIDISSADWREGSDAVHVSRGEGEFSDSMFFSFVRKQQRGTMTINLYDNETIAETIELLRLVNSEEEMNFTKLIYKVVSIIMYASLFKRERNRVDVREVKARRSQGLPSYRISEVRLIQPEYALHGVAKGENRNKNSNARHTHIVRGHWRSQPYGKREESKTRPTWIAPFWKGEAKDAVTKIVKI